MKKITSALIFMTLDIAVAISGATCYIISFFVDGKIKNILTALGHYGIGFIIGSLLALLAFIFLVKFFDEEL